MPLLLLYKETLIELRFEGIDSNYANLLLSRHVHNDKPWKDNNISLLRTFTILSGIILAKSWKRPEKIKMDILAFIFLLLYLYSNNYFLRYFN